MYKEYKFDNPAKALIKKQEMERTYGYRFPVYQIKEQSGKEWLSIVHPVGLQPNPRKRRNR